MDDIGARIAGLRENIGYTQQDLAKVFGVSRSAVNAWEMGKSFPGTQLMPRIAQFFRVSTDYLYGIKPAKSIDVSGLEDGDIEALVAVIERLRRKNITVS